MNKVRITVTDGMGRKYVHEATYSPIEKSDSIAAKDLIAGACVLRDGDTIEVSFVTVPELDSCDTTTPIPCPCGGFWPNDHVQGCTAKGMSELWPKAYAKELQEHPADTCKRLGITLD